MSKNSPALVISGTTITQDAEGRFSLNDLHKAAGAADKDKPGHFLNNDQTQGLIAQILSDGGIPPSVTIKGGKNQGSWVAKELVYRYAMWISPAFELKVTQRHRNKIHLQDQSGGRAAVQLDWDGKQKHWLLTAYEKVGSGGASSADTSAVGTKGDTARLDPGPVASLLQQQKPINKRLT